MKENRPNRQSNTQAKATRGTRKEQPSARLVIAYALLQMMRQSAYSNLVAESRFDALESPRDRAFASTLFYGVLERQITLRRIVAADCRKPVEAEPRGAVHSGDGAVPTALSGQCAGAGCGE